jgi:hypothetical protein
MKRLRVFLSYNSKNKTLAGALKRELQRYGLKVFLAHDDIKPAITWLETIVAELLRADVFLPILTTAWAESNYTDQEFGAALASGALIIPLKVDVDPYGFMSRYQALRLRTSQIEQSTLRIAKTIHSEARLHARFLDAIIYDFAASSSYDEANQKSLLLRSFDRFTPNQVNKVLRGAIANDQIWHAYTAMNRIRAFISDNSDKTKTALVKKLLAKSV